VKGKVQDPQDVSQLIDGDVPVIRNAHVTKLGHVLHRTVSKLEYPSEGSPQLKCDMLSMETAKDAGAPMFLCAPFGGYRGEF
jgi:hypothetical protein